MILVARPSKPFQFTAKNTARRQAIIAEYDDDIETLYQSVQTSSQADIPVPPSWSAGNATEFVRAVVRSVMKHQITDGDDLFQHGCDR